MNITYIFRSKGQERSIERVFDPIMQYMAANGHLVKVSLAKSCKFWPLAMVYNMVKFSIASYLHRERIYHITGDVQYVACWMNPKNTRMTIHDCVTLHNEHTPQWLKRMVYKFWYEKPLRRLRKITCISEATRKDIVQFFPWVDEKLIVIPNSVGTEFMPCPKLFNAEMPMILHIGTRCNKNLERVIEALEGIHCKLLIIGKLNDRQSSLLEKWRINFENRFHITDEEIVAAYQEADIISFPSLFEGFGMPIIEGQAVGRPVLTSDREPMRSVAGEGACLVDPESVESIRNGFIKLIEDSTYRDIVNTAGIKNAKEYDIVAVSDAYASIYNNL